MFLNNYICQIIVTLNPILNVLYILPNTNIVFSLLLGWSSEPPGASGSSFAYQPSP